MGFIEIQNPTKKVPRPKTLEQAMPLNMLADGSDEEFLKRIGEFVESIKGGFPEDKKDLENRLAQNEIILLVAVFEDQLKSIHREVLRNNPKLLNPDKMVRLGRLSELGESAIIEEEIEKTIAALDREKVTDRAKAFEKLGIPWNVKVEKVERMLDLRNEILHEDMDKQVTGWDLNEFRNLVVSLPGHLFMLGARQYPNIFELLPEMVDYVSRNAVQTDQEQSSE